jgi:hypothetical protein
MSNYDKQAQQFLEKFGLKIRTVYMGLQINDLWDDKTHRPKYRVRITRKGGIGKKLTFTFWDSISNYEDGKEPSAYSILASIASDQTCPDTFQEFCAEYGYSDDSIKARRMFKLCLNLTTRMRNFFTITELGELSEIQ